MSSTVIIFDIEKLNKDDRKIYESMTDNEKHDFERIWVSIETQKARLLQTKNRSKERVRREQKTLSDKERKERTRRLIERGAILESIIQESEKMSNDDVKNILSKALGSPTIQDLIKEILSQLE